ncbi:helix-turn-helix domain-containing protein [Streptomyces sp. MT29]|nr:helix-turn-helix domain-containing protein [Streptomyces sp. MT29]
MSAEHMGMVFAAEGLDGSEKLLLLSYTNWTDPYGYCWPSEDRLVDDCGTSRSTVQRAKRKLIKKKLLKSVRRKNSQGEPISNLSRVNLPLLASMARAERTYDDNLIDQITFDDDTQGDPEATLRGTPDNPEPPSDLLTRHSDSYPESNRLLPGVKMTHVGMSQNDSPSLSDPEGISLSGPGSPTGDSSEQDGRETAAPEDDAASAAAEVPAPRRGKAEDGGQRAEVLELLLGLPGRMHRDDAVDLLPLATEALATGWTVPRLRDHLARRCDPDRVFDIAAVYRKHLKRLPTARPGQVFIRRRPYPRARSATGPAWPRIR